MLHGMFLFAIHFKYSSVYLLIPNILTIPSCLNLGILKAWLHYLSASSVAVDESCAILMPGALQ